LFLFVAYAAASVGYAQVIPGQALDASGAPQYRVDPFWPKPLPNRWSMQQVTGLYVEQKNDHVWFLNRGSAALPIELTAEGDPSPSLCCVRGPELIEADQAGNVVQAWGGPKYNPKWPTALQTVIVDTRGFVWISGEANEDSILKFTRDGKLVWDFDHRPPSGAKATPAVASPTIASSANSLRNRYAIAVSSSLSLVRFHGFVVDHRPAPPGSGPC